MYVVILILLSICVNFAQLKNFSFLIGAGRESLLSLPAR